MMDSTTAQRLIRENMPVVGSDNGQLAVVDHLEGETAIKLTKDDSGEHHYIPLAWVTSVDDAVHVDRTGDEVKQAWATSPEALEGAAEGSGPLPILRDVPPGETLDDLPASGHAVNSVDATIGQPLVARVQARKAELEAALAEVPEEDVRGREPIELALSTIAGLLTGDLKNVPAVVASDMNLWLERHKHLAERAVDPLTGEPAPLPSAATLQANREQSEPAARPLTDGTVTGPYVKQPS